MVEDHGASLRRLRARLDYALETGADTRPLRAELAAIEAAIADKAATADRAFHASVLHTETAIDAIASERLQNLSTLLMACPAQPTTINLTDPPMDLKSDPRHRAAVAAMADVKIAEEGLRRTLESKSTHCEDLARRVADLERRRAEMAARRQRGDHRPEDAGELALLDLDLGGLRKLQDAAEFGRGEVIAKSQANQEAIKACQRRLEEVEALMMTSELLTIRAKVDLQSAELGRSIAEWVQLLGPEASASTLPTMLDNARLLDKRLLTTMDQIDSLAKRAGRVGTPPWGASAPLLLRLRQLAMARGEL